MSTKQNILDAIELARELVEEGIDPACLHEHTEVLADSNEWIECTTQDHFCPLDGYKYRRKQKTITINGVEIPAPIYDGLRYKQIYYAIYQEAESGYIEYSFDDDILDKRCLKRGVYTNEDHIKQYVKALWGE